MKKINAVFVTLLIFCIEIAAQNTITGYINANDVLPQNQKVYISQVTLDPNTNEFISRIIASSHISKNGFFTFDKKNFSLQDRIYKIHLNRSIAKEKKEISDVIKAFSLFILSKKDSIHFQKSTIPFSKYTTSNQANKEWQKLKRRETQYKNLEESPDTKQYLLETRGYIKDSLQILLVKLISIKKLDEHNLLEKDIKANPKYYLDLLQELKSSELDPDAYIYFENKLLIVIQHLTNQKYQLSLLVNGIVILCILILSFILIQWHKKLKKPVSIPLSRQEKAIKELIISGKSNKEIANELFISLSTVKTHITNIYSKLNIANRQELLVKK